jgi:Flp pilus assembly protein TadG
VHTARPRLVPFVAPSTPRPNERKGDARNGTTIALQVDSWARPVGTLMKTAEPHSSSGDRRRSAMDRRNARCCFARGQSLVELALVLPILLMLLVGIIEIGRFAYYSILVSNAARAGAQYGAQGLATAADTLGIQTAAQNDGLASLGVTSKQLCGCTGNSLDACPTTPPAPTCGAPNHPLVYVQVKATGTFNPLFNYPGLPGAIPVNSTEQMRVAQ